MIPVAGQPGGDRDGEAMQWVAYECKPYCRHGDDPHLYLGAIDPDRCAACAAYPSLPCVQHDGRYPAR